MSVNIGIYISKLFCIVLTLVNNCFCCPFFMLHILNNLMILNKFQISHSWSEGGKGWKEKSHPNSYGQRGGGIKKAKHLVYFVDVPLACTLLTIRNTST